MTFLFSKKVLLKINNTNYIFLGVESDLTASEFLNKLNWSLLEYLVYSPDEAAASRSTVPEDDRELRNLRFNYKEYEEGWRQ